MLLRLAAQGRTRSSSSREQRIVALACRFESSFFPSPNCTITSPLRRPPNRQPKNFSWQDPPAPAHAQGGAGAGAGAGARTARVTALSCLPGKWKPSAGGGRLQDCRLVPSVAGRGGQGQSWVSFHRQIWSSGREWVQGFTKKEMALLRPRLNAWGSTFGGGGRRHFGGGGGIYIDPQLALGLLISANVGVFFLWRTLGPNYFMNSNFMVSAQALKEGRLHTLVTSSFSQNTLEHLLTNMVGLYFFGSEIGNLFGGKRLILLYLTGGVVGSLAHVAYWAYVMPWIEGNRRSLSYGSEGLIGASGAVNAIILLDILLFPTRIVYLNLILPVPAAVLGVLVIGTDLWRARDGRQSGTSAAAHLGGAFVGSLAWLRWRW